MSQHADPSPTLRHVRDGFFAGSVFALAVLVGYAIEFSDRFMAPPAAALLPPGSQVAAPTPSVEPPAPAREPAPPAAPEARPAPEPQRVEEPPPPPPKPWPSPVHGIVRTGDREPVAGAAVVAEGRELLTGPDGVFTFERLSPGAPLLVKMPGYAKVTVEPTADPIEVVLKPRAVKAAYLTYYGVNDRGIRGRVLDLIDRTELNAVVIDVKGDRGWILYPTAVPLALAAGAQGPATMRQFPRLMADLKTRGVYTIARIVTFKDNVLASHRPDLAVIDTHSGRPWIDNEKLAWVDPFREEVWSYNIEIAMEAVRQGFDEVQFDYVRFPTDGRLSSARYARPNTKETRLPTIAAFLGRARREIGATGAFVAADLFGYTAFNDTDTDIGQRVEELAPHLDFLCPMVYPSGYHRGIPGYRNPVEHPYRVVFESVRLTRKRSASAATRVRPWIQDFRDYAFDRRPFGAGEVQAQMRAADEAGSAGWMLWNPRNEYTGAALRPKGDVAATGTANKTLQD
jgi:hypothetical protein